MLPEEERKRLIEADWEVNSVDGFKFQSSIQVITDERPGVLVEITQVINEAGLTILYLDARVSKDHLTDTFNITLEITSKHQLDQLSNKLMKIRGMRDIVRTSK